MATCGTLNVLAIKGLDVVSTPPGARTWLAPGRKISVDKVTNTLDTRLVTKDYNIK